MSSTDVSNLSAAVAGIQIDGPTTPTASGRIELNDENILQVLPGEIDSAVGSVVQPTVIEDAANATSRTAVADITVETKPYPGTFGDERLPGSRRERRRALRPARLRRHAGAGRAGDHRAPGHLRRRRQV